MLLDYNIIIINENARLHIFNLKDINQEMKDYIDSKLPKIAEGEKQISLEIVKNKIKKFLNNKDEKTRMGIVAEFFIHLYLNYHGYKQECLFLNLEENSIKKGFDGYYSKCEQEWIMESKSGMTTTRDISHKAKIKKAYDDIENKLAGETSNNPWDNAYNHARIANAENSIIQNINRLSNEFEEGKFHDIKDFNIIPSSTIFLNNFWDNNLIKNIESDIRGLILNLKYRKIEIICLTKKSLNLFMSYLEVE